MFNNNLLQKKGEKEKWDAFVVLYPSCFSSLPKICVQNAT